MRKYYLTFAGLVVLTALTLGLSFVPLAPFAGLIAVTIAIAKALLIAIFFMHLDEHRTASRAAFGIGLALFAVLFAFTLLDVYSRGGVEIRPPVESDGAANPRAPAGSTRGRSAPGLPSS